MKQAFEDHGDHVELVGAEGERLSAVTFVQDYLQLHFDGPRLTLVSWPVVIDGDVRHFFGGPGYRDRLCGMIGRIVARAYVRAGDRLQIEFTDGASIMTSLAPEVYRAAHVVVFDDGKSNQWAAW